MTETTPERAKRIRRAFDLTQMAFAEALGMSFGSVNAWECGRSEPKRLGAVYLDLLDRALTQHCPACILVAMEADSHTARVRGLVFLTLG